MYLLSFLILCSHAYAPQAISWKNIPNVIICKESKVKIEDVKVAAKFWEAKGHTFSDFKYAENCDKYKYGYILFIGDSNLDSQYSGMTEVFEYKDRISSAYIEIWDGNSTNLKVITHELGHAIGYEHVNNIYNIMYDAPPDAKVTIRR